MNRKPWFLNLFRPYVRRRLRRTFDGVWVSGLEHLGPLIRSQPVILAPNHVCWWDPLVLVALDQALGSPTFALMDKDNLESLPFFGWLGAVAIDRSSMTASRAGLREAEGLLTSAAGALWVFPQGRQRPAHLRPLDLKRGVELLSRRSGVPTIPVGLNYLYRERDKPSCMVSFGNPIASGPDFMQALEQGIIHELEEIDAFAEGAAGFVDLIEAPTNRSEATLATRLLGLATEVDRG